MKRTNHHTIQIKLNAFIKKYYLRDVYKGILINISGGISLLVMFAVAEYFIRFNSSSRLFLFLSFTSLFGISLIKFLIIPLLKVFGLTKLISDENASFLIGKHFPDIKDQLTNLIQLQREENNDLVIASINQKAKNISPFEFKEAISFKGVLNLAKWSLVPLFFIVLISFWNSKIIPQGTERIVNFNQKYNPENPFQFNILNDAFTVVRSDDYSLRIEFTGKKIPNDVYVLKGSNQYRLSKINVRVFEFIFRNVQQSINFKLKTAGFSSTNYTLNLIEKPTISNFNVRLVFPKHTKKPNEEINNKGDLFVPEGTEITWFLNSVFTTQINFIVDDSIHNITPIKDRSEFNQIALSSFNYTIVPKENIFGDKMLYRVHVIKDQFPKIKVKTILDTVNPLYLLHSGLISDDYGFKKLNFCFQNKDTAGKINIPIPNVEFQYNFNHGINVNNLGFLAGDEFTYYFEIFDNDAINGFKKTKSVLERFKIPSLKEVADLLANNNGLIKNQLDKNIKEAQNLQEEFDDLQKMISEKKKMDWQDKARLEEFIGHQNQFKEKIEKLQFDQEKNNFQKEQLSPQEKNLLEKKNQINKLFEELMDEETKKLYDKLEKMLEEFQEDKIKEALEEINLSNEELEKELDRTLEIFKQIEFDEKLEKTIKKLEKLSKDQEIFSKETKENNEKTKEELQKKQKGINKKFEDIQKDIISLGEKNQELENKRSFENTKEQQEEIKKSQEKSSTELANNKRKKASKNQKKASDDMKNLSEKMKKMQKEQQQQQDMEDINSLRQILENLISLSVEQETLMKQIKAINRFDPQFPVLATTQGNLRESAKIIEDSLLALSKRQIGLESIINKEILDIKYNMNKSIDFLRERKNYNATTKQQYAMTAANNLALLLDESLQQMQSQMKKKSGGGSCSKPGGSQPKPGGIKDIKQMQQKLSDQIKKMMEEMKDGNKPGEKGKKGKNGLAKSLAQMSAKQNALKEQLKKLENQNKKQGGGLGDFKSLLEKLEENEKDLLNKNLTRETINRQQEIMSKLLKAENSIRERELEKKRKSKKGQNSFSRNPDDFSTYKTLKLKEQEALKIIPPSFNLYYKKKISEYFNKFVK